jgi:hypothetical protein
LIIIASFSSNTSRQHVISYHSQLAHVFFRFLSFIRQQLVQLQNSISEHLHHHTFSNMFFDKISKAHHAHILSCFSPRVSVWLTLWPIFPSFQQAFPIFFTTFWIWFKLPHPLIANILWCVCTHPYGYPPFTLCSWQWAHKNPWCSSWHMHQTCNYESKRLFGKRTTRPFSQKKHLHANEFLNEIFYKLIFKYFNVPQCITFFLLIIIE